MSDFDPHAGTKRDTDTHKNMWFTLEFHFPVPIYVEKFEKITLVLQSFRDIQRCRTPQVSNLSRLRLMR